MKEECKRSYSSTPLGFVAAFGLILGLVFLMGCESEDPDIVAGEEIVKGTCKACHASGINGAPILGNKKMWGPRVTQDVDTLVSHASNGFGLMPAKGGNESLTDDQIRQAIKYMLYRLEVAE
ncbi:MAG: c-type cytochrome [Cellvibrionaceae bacterium]